MKSQLELQVLDVIPETIQAVKTEQDSSYQNFTYCLVNRNHHVGYLSHAPINYPKAESEIASLDWTYQKNGISIFNTKTNENIFSSRLKEDRWFVLTAVLENNVYKGYQWSSYPNTKRLLSTLRAFFDEMFWFDTLDWTKIKWETEVNA